MKYIKKIISLVVCIAMLFTICSTAIAAEPLTPMKITNENSFMVGDILYVEEKTDDGYYNLTAYKGDQILNKVTIRMGSDIMQLQIYDGISPSSANTYASRAQTIKLSEHISTESSSINTITPFSSALTGNIGSITYQVLESSGYVYHSLNFNSKLIKSLLDQTHNINYGSGTVLSAVIAGIVAAFSYAISGGIATAIIIAVGGSISGSILTNAINTTLIGDAYIYNLTATTNDGTGRSVTYGGEEYHGEVLVNGQYVYKDIYTGCYPNFINKRDMVVATTYFDAFWYSSSWDVRFWY